MLIFNNSLGIRKVTFRHIWFLIVEINSKSFMGKQLLAIAVMSMLLISCGSSKSSTNDLANNTVIATKIDLTEVHRDQVPVSVNPGRFVSDTVVYRLPRVVQGTYAVGDYGSFIDSLKALDYQGKELRTERLDTNSWAIYGSKELDQVTYWVNDTFDLEGSGTSTPFSPAGTNIESTNYVLNLHGFIGYFDSLKDNSYVLEVVSPTAFKRTAALKVIDEETNEDGSVTTTRYAADRYFDITDNPMMFGELDVEEFQVGDIQIVLSVYSPNGKHSAKHLKETMYKMMEAQKAYLGSVNSTKRYDIYLYLADNTDEAPGGFGALEHHTSTVVVMAESMSEAGLDASMIDVVSHEFFHILTPLSVHSEDVHYFDYHDPSFSKHLWMYEGLTEYFATHFQVNQGLVEEEEFYGELMEKIQTAATMNDEMSFTVMSENILEQPYASNYYNVYQKGALIGMCLDIIIREQSGGERGILSLMKELSEKYGVNQPFEDDSIIQEITAMTYPEVGDFFEKHVVGNTPIDYNVYFSKVGLGMVEGRIQTNYIMNNGALILKGSHEQGTIFFTEAVKENSFWNDNGVLPGDVIKEIDGNVITLENANAIIGTAYSWVPGQKVEVKLERDGEEYTIAKELTPSYTTGMKLGRKQGASEEELKILEAWLRG